MKIYVEGNTVHIPKDSALKRIFNELFFIYGVDAKASGEEYTLELPESDDRRQCIMARIRKEAFLNNEETDETLREESNAWWERYHAEARAWKEQMRQRQRISVYEYHCKNGCERCGQMEAIDWESDGYIYRCKATGKVLEKKNIPTYGPDGVYYLFNWVSVPSEDCPYNAKEADHA